MSLNCGKGEILKRLQPVFFIKTCLCEQKTGSKKPKTQNEYWLFYFKQQAFAKFT